MLILEHQWNTNRLHVKEKESQHFIIIIKTWHLSFATKFEGILDNKFFHYHKKDFQYNI